MLLLDYVDEMTGNIEGGLEYWNSRKEMGERKMKKLNGGPKTREVNVHALCE